MADAAAAQDQPSPGWYQRFKNSVKKLKREVLAVYYALGSPEVGWLPRLISIIAIGYALSPLDLIPDFIPILGLLDDLIVLPGLLLLAVFLIPPGVMEAARQRAAAEPLRLASNWVAACLFLLIWNATFAWIAWLLVIHFGSSAVMPFKWWIVGGTVFIATTGEAIWATLQIRSERRRREAVAASAEEPLLAEEP